jgi:hypothetical protein
MAVKNRANPAGQGNYPNFPMANFPRFLQRAYMAHNNNIGEANG